MQKSDSFKIFNYFQLRPKENKLHAVVKNLPDLEGQKNIPPDCVLNYHFLF